MLARLLIASSLVAAGCGSSSSADKGCRDTEVEVAYLGGPRDNEVVCKPIPASCGTVGDCGVNACIRDMYGYCDSPYLGKACSDTFPPTIISCNP